MAPHRQGLSPASDGERMQAAKLYSERTGADFVTAQGVVNSI